MKNKLSPVVFLFTLAAVILGGTAGYFMPEFMLSISFIGKLFLNSLKIIAIPFVITMIIGGIASMGSKDKVKRSLGKTGLYFLATSLTASVVGVLLALVIQPGVGAVKNGAYFPQELVPHLSNFSFNNLFGSIIPENFLAASIEMQFFAFILIALVLGTVLTTGDRKNKIVLDFFVSLKELLSQFMKIILYIAPIGLFSLSGTLFAENGSNAEVLFSSLALFSVTIIFGLSFFALVLLPIIAKLFSNVSPYQYFTSMIPALSTAFATNSAIATLPITEECIKTTSVDQRASAFVLPLGALFNASGTALFLSASAIFISQLYGPTITIGQILVVIGGSFFIASMTAFIPYASLLMLALVLQLANFPVSVISGIGIIILADFLFGRIRSVVDVWSDAVGVAVLGNTFDFKTARSAKAAIPAKRTYNKTKTKTTRDSSKDKTDYPKTKRENKVSSKSKPANGRKKTRELPKKETISKDTKSPFQISPETNYFAETDKNNETDLQVKPEKKKQKTPVVKHEIKVPKIPQSVSKKDSPKKEMTAVKEQKKPERTKPIIHKIEVPPLPIIKVKQPEPMAAEKQTDDDSVITKASAILSQDTIERERSKIAAQLNLMREKESLLSFPEEIKIPKVIVPEVKKTELDQEDQFTKIDFYADDEPSVLNEPVELDEPVVPIKKTKTSTTDDKIVTSPDKQTAPVIEEEVVSEEPVVSDKPVIIDEPVITDEPVDLEETVTVATPEEKSSISYGRKSSKRLATKKPTESDTAEKSESEPEPETVTAEKNEFAVEKMSFGRGKRKK